jgi:DNA gyrase/topoisomerase IV subunit B
MSKQESTFVESIRMRPAMYAGDLTLRGIKNMLGYLFEEITSDQLLYVEI